MASSCRLRLIVTIFFMHIHQIACVVDTGDVFHCPQDFCCQDLRRDTLLNLNISYECSRPESVMIIPPLGTNRTSSFTLIHSDVCVTSLPRNICDYPNIASISFKGSSLKSIPSLSCLKNLLALDLSYNDIEIVKSNIFTGLTRLRYIDLRSNRIRHIEPHTFKDDLHALMIVKLDENRLTTCGPWPLTIKHHFCRFGLSYNQIERFTHEENWRVDLSQDYGPGEVDFSNNNFTTWITEQLKVYGFTDLRTLGKLMALAFDFRNNPWRCDCNMYEFLKLASNFPLLVTRYYFEVYCESPPHLKGTKIIDLPLEAFVCNITLKCPVGCFCQNQPERGQMLIDCVDKNLSRMPLDLPHGNLKLLFSNNSIKTLEARPYLDRTRYIDLSNNDLVHIAEDAMGLLQNIVEFVNLSHNQILRLPKSIQNIQLSKLDLEDNYFICDCKSAWMSNWLRRLPKDHNVSRFQCWTSDEPNVDVMQADDDYLGCHVYPVSTAISVILAVLSVLFITTVIVLIVFRYEVMVLIHVTLKRKLKNMDGDVFDYDVLISVDEDSEDDRMWTSLTLLPELEQNHHLRVYYPPRDMDPGSVTVHEFIAALKKSSAALIVLSDNYAANPTTMYQFLEAYKIMEKQRRGKLIIVRYTNVEKASNGYLNALIRLKKYLEKDEMDLFKRIVNNVRNEISTSPRSLIHSRI